MSLEVRFDDDVGIDAKSLGNNDVRLVKAGGGYSVGGRLMIGSAIRNGSVLSMLYEFPAPGGSWDAADNGTYNVVVQVGSVRDVSGNSIAARTLGTLTVNFPAGTPISPWATLSASDITTETNTHTFTIIYADDVAIAVASVQDDRQEVFVEPSNGLGEFAELVSVSQQANGTPIVATYRVTFGQTWRAADNGVDFEVSLFSGGVSGTVTDTSGNRVRGPYLGAFKVRLANGPPDATAPQATTSASGVSLQSDQPHWFAALFSDDQGIEATTIVPDSLFVVGPNGQEHPLMVANVNYGQNVRDVLATFGVQPPGGSWDPADDGVYRIAVRDGTVRDTSGNAIPGYITDVPAGGEVGSFMVAISNEPQPESAKALLNIAPLQAEAASHTFTVTYTSETGIDVSSLGSNDIFVTDNENYLKFAEFVSVDNSTNGSPRVATYRISGPSGPWTAADNKTYEVYVAGIEAPTVRSVGDNHVHAGFLGNLIVNIVAAPLPPEIDVRGNGQSIADGDTTPDLGDHTDFGTASVSGAVVIRTFTIANTGTGTLTISGNPMVQVSGANASDFSVTSLPASSIIAGGSTTFQINFDPASAGVRTATITIANNDGDENPYNFVIRGNGAAAPEIDIRGNGISITDGDTTPSTTDDTNFGIVNVGNLVRIRTFTIANSGGADPHAHGNSDRPDQRRPCRRFLRGLLAVVDGRLWRNRDVPDRVRSQRRRRAHSHGEHSQQ